MCEVTVVIPNYNGQKYLLPCLRALYESSNVEMHVIVVDNGSEDQSITDAKELFPQVNYILLDRNYGFCRAVNVGIRTADTEYVLLLNNDTEVCVGFVEKLLRRIKRNPLIFSVEASVRKYNRQCRTFAACAGAAIYRKAVFEEIGYFDEKHFAYLEDIDIGYRARIYGYINLYEPKAQVIHVGSAASGSRYNEFKTRYSVRNNIYLIYKNMPAWQMAVNGLPIAAGMFVKYLFFKKLG